MSETEEEKESGQIANLKEAIKWYRRENINLIPLQHRDKKPVESWKRFQTEKITDIEIEKWFLGTEQHNVGAVCGTISDNLFVIDCDSTEIFDKFFPKKDGLTYVITGRGAHVYFKADTAIKPLKCFDDKGREIITLKSEGGYVVGIGSTHPNGSIYTLSNSGEIPRLKGNVREDMKKRAIGIGLNFGNAEAGSEVIDTAEILLGSVRGSQDTSILHLSHYLRRQGATFEEALSILEMWNKRNNPIIPELEIYTKLKNHYALPEPFSFFYKTNPAKISIQPDLSLQRTESVISVSAYDLMDTDANGKQTINKDRVCDFIEANYSFKGVIDTEQLLFYRDGIYFPAQGELDRILQRIFGADATIRFKAEMKKQIQDRNPIERSEMDADKTYLPVENGLLNLKTYVLEPFTPDRLYTSGIPVMYIPEATAPDFLTFINQVVSKEDVLLLQEWTGYCLWRGYPNAKALFLIGNGGNGKGVLTEVLTAFLGNDNVSALPLTEMDGHHRFSTFSLYGKLMNISAEPPTDKALETSLFKLITGNSAVEAEQKGVQTRLKFRNFAKLVVEANTVPQILDTKEALWDRIIAVEFPHVFRGGVNEILNLGEELSTPKNLSGVLVWALAGLARLRSNNFRFTLSRAQESKKTEMQIVTNPLLAFQNQWLTFSRKLEISKQTVYDAYDLFCVVNEIPTFNKGIISKGILKDRRISVQRIRENGLRLRIFTGCSLSNTVIAAYGRYRGRPLKSGEIDDIENPEEEVEIRTCDLEEYMVEYLEPMEEVQEPIDDKLIIFNSADLIELYKQQAADGVVKHIGPQAYEPEVKAQVKQPKNLEALSLKALSPLQEGQCERCGKTGFLTHELFDESGTKSLVCKGCSVEIEIEIGKEQPVVFGTTLDERRTQLKEEEGEKK